MKKEWMNTSLVGGDRDKMDIYISVDNWLVIFLGLPNSTSFFDHNNITFHNTKFFKTHFLNSERHVNLQPPEIYCGMINGLLLLSVHKIQDGILCLSV